MTSWDLKLEDNALSATFKTHRTEVTHEAYDSSVWIHKDPTLLALLSDR